MGKIQQLKLTLPLPKSINHIYGRNRYGKVYLQKEGKEYKQKVSEYIKEQIKKQQWIKLDKGQYCYIDEIIYFNKQHRDSDNIKKLEQDVITQSGVWYDDTYALARTQRVYVDRDNPRIEIIITPVEFQGIFESKEEVQDFIESCKTCIMYNRNCKKLTSALDNILNEEIIKNNNKWKCLKKKERKGRK